MQSLHIPFAGLIRIFDKWKGVVGATQQTSLQRSTKKQFSPQTCPGALNSHALGRGQYFSNLVLWAPCPACFRCLPVTAPSSQVTRSLSGFSKALWRADYLNRVCIRARNPKLQDGKKCPNNTALSFKLQTIRLHKRYRATQQQWVGQPTRRTQKKNVNPHLNIIIQRIHHHPYGTSH